MDPNSHSSLDVNRRSFLKASVTAGAAASVLDQGRSRRDRSVGLLSQILTL